MIDGEALIQVAFVSFVLMQFVEALVKPAIAIANAALEGQPVKALALKLWPLYVTAAIGGCIGWFAGYNLLPMFDPPVIGRVLTAIGIGLGPSFLYDAFQDKGQNPL